MRLVLIDGSNLFWRSYWGLKESALSEEGHETFAVHGMINAVARAVKDHGPTHLVVAFDDGISSKRRAIDPHYKEHRQAGSAPDPQAREQLVETRRILNVMGLFVWRESDTEADDILACAAMRWHEEPGVESVVVVTGDKDLRQLVRHNVVVAAPALGGKTAKAAEEWTESRVIEKYGVKSDGIAGVPRVGEKTARKLLEKHGSLSMACMDPKVEEYARVVARAYDLIKLDGSGARCPFTLPMIAFQPTKPGDVLSGQTEQSLRDLGLGSIEARWRRGDLWRPTPGRRLVERPRLVS
jgi:5'-3' exonuclease